jgi:glutathione-independent formaldehyde dehydrogenase
LRAPGRCAAASAHLLGASCIIVGDTNSERLKLVKDAGYKTVNVASETPIADQIEAILGVRDVDCGVDAVGFEAHGNGPGAGEDPAAVLNTLIEVVRENGAIGAPGIYTGGDPDAIDKDAKAGTYRIDFGKAWIKSPHISAGQAPIMHYNRDLMMAILWDRMPYLGKLVNVEVVPLEKALDAYKIFDQGSPKKFVLDPHGSVAKAA